MCSDGRVMRYVSRSGDGLAVVGSGVREYIACPICLTFIVLENEAFWALYPCS